ncbi:MAG: hypothetical protein JWP89_2658 [Schlesneria sp.]|nr:hypothetical protein [Schlesneria sp.]
MNPVIEHVVFSGVTRHGKTKACIKTNLPRMRMRDGPAFVWIDPPGTGVEEAQGHLVRYGIPFLADTLHETGTTLGYDFFSPSQNPDSEQREAENREAVFEAIAVAIRSRGLTSVEGNPIIRQGLQDAFSILINQKTAVPFTILRNCFVKESDNFQYLVEHCTDPQTYLKFMYYGGLSAKDREYHCGPAERIIQAICDCPQFKRRCVPTFDLAEFLNEGGKLFIDGRSVGNLSRPDSSLLMGQIILTVIRLARSGKLKRRVVLIIDEGKNADLIDLNLVRAMAEAGKWGLEIQVLIQNPLFKDMNITDELFQNANTRFLFKHTNPASAQFVAEMIGYPKLDPLVIRKTEYRTVQRHDGFDLEQVISTGEWKSEDGKAGASTNHGTVARPRYKEEIEEHDVLYSLDDLIKLKRRDVTNLGVGECHIMQGNSVTNQPEYLPMLQDPWPGQKFSRHPYIPRWQEELRVYLEQLKATNPAYQCGVIKLPAWTPPPQPPKKRKSGLD